MDGPVKTPITDGQATPLSGPVAMSHHSLSVRNDSSVYCVDNGPLMVLSEHWVCLLLSECTGCTQTFSSFLQGASLGGGHCGTWVRGGG